MIRQNHETGERRLDLLRWGLIPPAKLLLADIVRLPGDTKADQNFYLQKCAAPH